MLTISHFSAVVSIDHHGVRVSHLGPTEVAYLLHHYNPTIISITRHIAIGNGHAAEALDFFIELLSRWKIRAQFS